MAHYSIYLVPREESLTTALDNHESIRPFYDAVKACEDWGGQLHMTLCHFAGRKGHPAERNGKMCEHNGSLTEAAKAAAKAGNKVLDGKRFDIKANKWKGTVRVEKGLYKMDFQRTSGTLSVVLKTLKEHGVKGAKLDKKEDGTYEENLHKLHVTFLFEADAEDPGAVTAERERFQAAESELAEFLSELQWDVAVVKIPEDEPDAMGNGHNLVINDRFALGA